MQFKTQILSPDNIEAAVRYIEQGECVAFPTETVYGLGANALDAGAVAKIFQAKGRPADNPLIIHCYHQSQLPSLVMTWSQDVQDLMDAFWPGPLTLVLPKKAAVPDVVTAGLDTVAVRIPDHPVALAFLEAVKIPIAAPSANVSGKPSPTRAEHVWQDLAGRIPAIIDGGATGWGIESTVLDCSCRPFRVLRPGGVTVEQLQQYGAVQVDSGVFNEVIDSPRSPGMKYKHYSPEAKVILVVGANIQQEIRRQLEQFRRQGRRVAVLAFSEFKANYPDVEVLELGSINNLQQAAANLYHLFRKADDLGCEIILAEGLPDTDLGLSIMNRLRKAAGASIIRT